MNLRTGGFSVVKTTRNSFLKTFKYLVIASILFGTMPLFVNILTPYLSDSTIIIGRFMISFLILLLYCLLSKKNLRLDNAQDTVWVVIAGLFMIAYAFAFVRALDIYGSSRTLVWTYIFVILTTSLHDEIKYFGNTKERDSKYFFQTIVSILVLFFALVFSNPLDEFSVRGIIDSMSWTSLGAISGFLFGMRIIFIKYVLDMKIETNGKTKNAYNNREEAVLLREQLFTFIFALSFMIIAPYLEINANNMNTFSFSIENIYGWLPLFVLVLLAGVSTAIPGVLLYKGLSVVKNSSSSQTIATLEIVIGVMLMAIFTEEIMQPQQYFSTLLIFVAIAIKTNFICELRECLISTKHNEGTTN